MKSIVNSESVTSILQNEEEQPITINNSVYIKAFEELERFMKEGSKTYSNVHRGTGHFSLTTTELFEQARDIILDYLGLDKAKYINRLIAFNRNGTPFLSRTTIQEQMEEFFQTHAQKVYPIGPGKKLIKVEPMLINV